MTITETINNWTRALFDLAKTSNELLTKITNDVIVILRVIKENKEYLKMLNSFDILEQEKFQLINEAFSSYHPYILNTIKLATKKHVVKYLDVILHRFIEMSNDKLNIKYGYVYSTKELSNNYLLRLQTKLSNQLKSKVFLTNVIDTNLIGGIKIKVDEFLIDNSVLGKLNKLKSLV